GQRRTADRAAAADSPLYYQGRFAGVGPFPRSPGGALRHHGQCHLARFHRFGQRAQGRARSGGQANPRRLCGERRRRRFSGSFLAIRRSPLRQRREYPAQRRLGSVALWRPSKITIRRWNWLSAPWTTRWLENWTTRFASTNNPSPFVQLRMLTLIWVG